MSGLDPALALGSAIAIATAVLAGCGRREHAPPEHTGDAAPPWQAETSAPAPRPGMVHVPKGVLIAGTPPNSVPRVADQEMAGEQVVLGGFYIDVFPHPNEAGAIPTTGLTYAQAEALCERSGKRLCTELEWERACKGPANTMYEYGDEYREAACGTGTERALTPNGVHAQCVSGFGAFDMHGGVANWTSSEWRRDPSASGLRTVRGGNGREGKLVARCANGRGVRETSAPKDVGVRCCAGEKNEFEVVLHVAKGDPLRLRPRDPRGPALAKLAADLSSGTKGEDFEVERVWVWHPLGNEELLLAGGCAGPPARGRCGVIVARQRFEAFSLVAFVPSEALTPIVGESDEARHIFVYGGDREGAFRKRVSYDWGTVAEGSKERKRRRKGKREPSFD